MSFFLLLFLPLLNVPAEGRAEDAEPKYIPSAMLPLSRFQTGQAFFARFHPLHCVPYYLPVNSTGQVS